MNEHYSPPPPGLSNGKRVWCYLRDSGGNAQERSVEQQEHEIKAYCEKHKLNLERIFRDVAKSGGSTAGRAEFMSLIELAEDEDIRPHGLLLWNFARFARNKRQGQIYKSQLRMNGIVVHSITDQIPSDDHIGELIEDVTDWMNEEKRRQISRDVKRGLKSLVNMGKGYAPGTPPRGYKGVPVEIGTKRDGKPRIVSKWEPDPVLSEYVKIAFEMRAQGKSYKEITKATNGKLYTCVSSWRDFFRNVSYIGYYGKDGNTITDHHEPLITWEVFEAVQKQAKHSLRGGEGGGMYHPRRVGGPHLLTGLAYCEECGTLFAHSYGNKKQPWEFYLCGKKNRHGYSACTSKRIGAKNAEKQIIESVLNKVLTTEYLNEVITATKKKFLSTDEAERQITAARRSFENLEIAIQRTLDTIEKTGSKSAQERLEQRESEKLQVKNEIERLSAELAASQIELTAAAIEKIAKKWRDQFTEAQKSEDISIRKDALKRFVSRVDLGYNKAIIKYTYPMTELFSTKQVETASLRGGTTSFENQASKNKPVA